MGAVVEVDQYPERVLQGADQGCRVGQNRLRGPHTATQRSSPWMPKAVIEPAGRSCFCARQPSDRFARTPLVKVASAIWMVPSSPARTARNSSFIAGLKRCSWPTPRTTRLAWQAATAATASQRLRTSGFSQKTCFWRPRPLRSDWHAGCVACRESPRRESGSASAAL